MKNSIVIIFIFSTISLHAQTNFEAFLASVEKNNKEIISAKSLLEAEILNTKTGLLPENPFLEYGSFPGSDGASGTRKVIGITQSFEFPTVYFLKAKVAKNEATAHEYQFLVKRKEVLEHAGLMFFEYIFLAKQNQILKERLSNAENLKVIIDKKLEVGGTSIIEANKTRLQYIELKSSFTEIECELNHQKEKLVYLNGNQEFIMSDTNYFNFTSPNIDSIIIEISNQSPEFLALDAKTQSSYYQLTTTKNQWLPDFSIGYEQETEPNATYKGIKLGLEIPLWNQANGIKHAKAKFNYYNDLSEDIKSQMISSISLLYEHTVEIKYILDEMKSSIENYSNQDYLHQAFEIGEISLIDYINELSFYYQIEDRILELEKEYYMNRLKIMSYKL